MNEILKRIEEKSKELGQMFFPDNMNPWARPNWEAGYVETACKEVSNFILSNQWISVEEALPEDTELYFVAYKAMDGVLYSTGCYEAKFKEWYVDGYGYNADVTHWMPIPSLIGGEK